MIIHHLILIIEKITSYLFHINVSSLHYNDNNSYFFDNEKEIYQFKADNQHFDFWIQFYLRSISKKFDAIDYREVSLEGNWYDFSVDYNTIAKSVNLNIHADNITIGSLSFTGSLATKYMSLNNKQCKTIPYFLSVTKLNFSPVRISLSEGIGNCNTFTEPSVRSCIQNKT